MAASSLVDACRFNPTAGGTTDWTYSTAVTGYQSPAAASVVNGAQYSYRAESNDLSQWEIGTGAWNSGTGVLPRTTVLFNSSGGTSKINFSTVPQVAIVALAEDMKFAAGLSGFVNSVAGSDIAMTTNVYADGPSVAQGTSGTFFATGTITLVDTVAATLFHAKLWDGTTVIASASQVSFSASNPCSISLSGIITNPAANIRISAVDTSTGNHGLIKFNETGNSKDSTISVLRVA